MPESGSRRKRVSLLEGRARPLVRRQVRPLCRTLQPDHRQARPMCPLLLPVLRRLRLVCRMPWLGRRPARLACHTRQAARR